MCFISPLSRECVRFCDVTGSHFHSVFFFESADFFRLSLQNYAERCTELTRSGFALSLSLCFCTKSRAREGRATMREAWFCRRESFFASLSSWKFWERRNRTNNTRAKIHDINAHLFSIVCHFLNLKLKSPLLRVYWNEVNWMDPDKSLPTVAELNSGENIWKRENKLKQSKTWVI